MMGFLASPGTTVLPDQKMAFMINRTVASCGAVKFKSITKEGVTCDCAPLQRLALSTKKWSVSVVQLFIVA